MWRSCGESGGLTRGALVRRGAVEGAGVLLLGSSAGTVGALRLEMSELRGPIAQIAANEAQHLSAFPQLHGRSLVGKPFAASLPIDAVSAQLDRYES
jgi:hypothetical protein